MKLITILIIQFCLEINLSIILLLHMDFYIKRNCLFYGKIIHLKHISFIETSYSIVYLNNKHININNYMMLNELT